MIVVLNAILKTTYCAEVECFNDKGILSSIVVVLASGWCGGYMSSVVSDSSRG